MKYLRLWWLLLNLTVCFASNAQVSLKVDAQTSKLTWFASKPIATHYGTLKLASGNILIKNGQLTGGLFVLDMRSIIVLDLKGHDKETVEGNFQSDYFFDTRRYPTARLELISVKQAADSAAIRARLTLHGIPKEISFMAVISEITANRFTGSATIRINRRDWQIATGNIMYNTLIYPTIRLEVIINAHK